MENLETPVRILVVDDEPDIRNILHILLSSRGYEVDEAENGLRAVELVRAGSLRAWRATTSACARAKRSCSCSAASFSSTAWAMIFRLSLSCRSRRRTRMGKRAARRMTVVSVPKASAPRGSPMGQGTPRLRFGIASGETFPLRSEIRCAQHLLGKEKAARTPTAPAGRKLRTRIAPPVPPEELPRTPQSKKHRLPIGRRCFLPFKNSVFTSRCLSRAPAR